MSDETGITNVNDLELLIEFHREAERQGPGSPETTRRAIELAGLDVLPAPRIADLGCGTGASALLMAGDLGARVTAVDLAPALIAELEARASRAGLAGSIEVETASIESPPLDDAAFDAIWSEGAVYNIGFERGVRDWRRFLRPGGVLAVSEITWLTAERPRELDEFWTHAYAEIDTAAHKLGALERHGYAPIGYFVLPARDWTDHYYTPMEARFDAFLDRHGRSAAAQALVDGERREIELYRRFAAFYGYGFYIARRCD